MYFNNYLIIIQKSLYMELGICFYHRLLLCKIIHHEAPVKPDIILNYKYFISLTVSWCLDMIGFYSMSNCWELFYV